MAQMIRCGGFNSEFGISLTGAGAARKGVIAMKREIIGMYGAKALTECPTVQLPSQMFLSRRDSMGRELPADKLTALQYHPTSFLTSDCDLQTHKLIAEDLYMRYARRLPWEEGRISLATDMVHNRQVVHFDAAMQAFLNGGQTLFAKFPKGPTVVREALKHVEYQSGSFDDEAGRGRGPRVWTLVRSEGGQGSSSGFQRPGGVHESEIGEPILIGPGDHPDDYYYNDRPFYKNAHCEHLS